MPEPQSSASDDVPAVAVSLRDASLSYAGRPVFEAVGLELPAGAVTCLLGPSGVGKSSLLRLIAGLAPTSTAGRLGAGDGRPLAGRIAYMDQRDLLLPWLSVADNVALGRRLRGEAVDRARVALLLRAVGLEAVAGARPATLSGGMRQRAALARTLFEDRPVVLMDEPFSALDALTRFKLQDLAARLLAGRTVLLVTHDPMEALRLGHRIHVLAGAPARLDRPLEPEGRTPRDPASPAVQRLYGELLRRLGVGAAA
jgi:putative hydroxymethylpyrimidine transport system ATP-binding protein